MPLLSCYFHSVYIILELSPLPERTFITPSPIIICDIICDPDTSPFVLLCECIMVP